MVRNSSKFVCQQCSYESPRWFGRCPECGNWNSAVETVISGKRQEIKDFMEFKRQKKQSVRQKKKIDALGYKKNKKWYYSFFFI